MDVKTVTIYELQQKLKYQDDEISRLKKKIAYYQRILEIETDTDPFDLSSVRRQLKLSLHYSPFTLSVERVGLPAPPFPFAMSALAP